MEGNGAGDGRYKMLRFNACSLEQSRPLFCTCLLQVVATRRDRWALTVADLSAGFPVRAFGALWCHAEVWLHE